MGGGSLASVEEIPPGRPPAPVGSPRVVGAGFTPARDNEQLSTPGGGRARTEHRRPRQRPRDATSGGFAAANARPYGTGDDRGLIGVPGQIWASPSSMSLG